MFWKKWRDRVTKINRKTRKILPDIRNRVWASYSAESFLLIHYLLKNFLSNFNRAVFFIDHQRWQLNRLRCAKISTENRVPTGISPCILHDFARYFTYLRENPCFFFLATSWRHPECSKWFLWTLEGHTWTLKNQNDFFSI